jgi:hypothetical protein
VSSHHFIKEDLMMRKYLGFVVTGGMISAAILMFAQVPAYFRAWKTPLVAEQVQIKKERTVTVSQAAAKRGQARPLLCHVEEDSFDSKFDPSDLEDEREADHGRPGRGRDPSTDPKSRR